MIRLDSIPPRLLLSGLALALVIAAFAIGVVGPAAMALPGLLLLALVVLTALSRVIFLGGYIAAALSILLYIALVAVVVPFNEVRIVAAVVAAVAYGITAIMADLVTRRLYGMVLDLDTADALVEELTTRDQLTGTVKAHFARQVLGEELIRARRYNRPFAVMMVGLNDINSVGDDYDLEELFARVGRALTDRLRKVDKVAFLLNPPRFLCLLPETGLQGAIIVAERVVDEVRASTGVKFSSGVAAFPDDAVDADGLVEEAQSALEFAAMTGAPLAHRDILQNV